MADMIHGPDAPTATYRPGKAERERLIREFYRPQYDDFGRMHWADRLVVWSMTAVVCLIACVGVWALAWAAIWFLRLALVGGQ